MLYVNLSVLPVGNVSNLLLGMVKSGHTLYGLDAIKEMLKENEGTIVLIGGDDDGDGCIDVRRELEISPATTDSEWRQAQKSLKTWEERGYACWAYWCK